MQVPRSVGGLVRACHPEPTVAVTAVVTMLAAVAGRGAGVGWVAAAALSGQLSVGWSNDFVDRHRDAAVGRLDKPIVAGAVSARAVGLAAVVALTAAVALSFASGWRAALVHSAGLGAGWAYNLGVKSTPLSPVPYAVGFASLPAFVVLGLPGAPTPPAWLLLAGALLGVGAHFANVVPDIDDDIRQGVVGLPHRLGRRGSTLTAGLILVAATAVLTFGPPSGPGILGVTALVCAGLLAAGLLLPMAPDSRTPFRLAIAIAVLDTALFVVRGQSVLG